jgi:hypothetical protein
MDEEREDGRKGRKKFDGVMNPSKPTILRAHVLPADTLG